MFSIHDKHWIFTHSLYEHINFLASKYLYPVKDAFRRKCLKIRGVCFKVKYSMTNQSLSLTFKRNIFLTKILASAPLMWRIRGTMWSMKGNSYWRKVNSRALFCGVHGVLPPPPGKYLKRFVLFKYSSLTSVIFSHLE